MKTDPTSAKAAGREETFGLSEQECAELFNEGNLYYQRYIHCFQARDWPRTPTMAAVCTWP